MNYDGDIIRPPSEANSIIIQVTVGCSHNKCTFCGAYKGAEKKFRIRNDEEILENILFASQYCGRQKRVFLADGDALILSQKRLLHIFSLLKQHLPQVSRIALYGNAKAIRSKTLKELRELRSLGLHRIYMGLESGDDKVLENIQKGETAESMIKAGQLVREAGIFLSATVLLGIAGVTGGIRHAQESARVLSEMHPRQIAALCFMPLGNTPLGQHYKDGSFQLPNSKAILQELYELVANVTCEKVLFMANHASNYLPLSGVLTRDKEEMLHQIELALAGKQTLVPEQFRAL